MQTKQKRFLTFLLHSQQTRKSDSTIGAAPVDDSVTGGAPVDDGVTGTAPVDDGVLALHQSMTV